MNDKSTNNSAAEEIARKLEQVAGETRVNPQFAAELEQKLRKAHEPKPARFGVSFKQISPVLRWVALMVLLALVLSLSISTLIPGRQPAAGSTPTPADLPTPTTTASIHETLTPAPPDGGYDWRGTKLYLKAPLPSAPAQANVLLVKPDQPATLEEARSLAQQLGVNGQVYLAPGELRGATEFMFTDGKQRLYVRSKYYFTYFTDYPAYVLPLTNTEINDQEATATIEAFLKAHGFDFEYELQKENRSSDSYYVIPLTQDGRAIRFDYNMPARLQVTIGRDGQVLSLDSNRLEYEAVGSYDIRPAEAAFQQILDSSNSVPFGILESSQGGGTSRASFWGRSYTDGETVTIYGRVGTFLAVGLDMPALVTIDSYTVRGNLPSAPPDKLIEATGHFQTENGIRTFFVDSWQLTKATETSLMGTLHREGDQTVFISDAGEKFVLPDMPADVPLDTVPPNEQLTVNGMLSAGGDLAWTSIQYFPSGSNFGGGGGGGGVGFYNLNLSGTPVPFPAPTALPGSEPFVYTVAENDTLAYIAELFKVSVEELKQANNLTDEQVYLGQELVIPAKAGQLELPMIGKRIENERGLFVTTIFRQPDGSERKEYGWLRAPDGQYYSYLLKGEGLEQLEKYQNRPVNIWGTVEEADPNGRLIVRVEKYEIPFPDLKFELYEGKREEVTIDGHQRVLFKTTDGKKYVLRFPLGDYDDGPVYPDESPMILEGLVIPDEQFGGYPTLREFNGSMATSPKTGKRMEMQVTADQPYVIEEDPASQNVPPPSATIEKVELVYYITDLRYLPPDENAGPQYIQPVWRFYGHYSNGDEFEILVQALQPEYLLPEVVPATPPG